MAKLTKTRKPAVALVPVTEICWLLAGNGQEPLTRARIAQLVGEGMPKAARGEYDPIVCMHWYLGKLRPAVQRKATEGEDGTARNLQDERARLIAAQADAAEMVRDEKRGSLIPLDVHEQALASWAHTVKQRVLGLTARVVPKLDGQPREKMKPVLDTALKGCLSDIARTASAR